MPEASENALFPAFLQLANRLVVVIGGGEVALRKVQALIPTGAQIQVIAPEFNSELIELALRNASITLCTEHFTIEHLTDAWLVIAATDDVVVNQQVAQAANARKLWVNVVDDLARSTFQVPARVERGPLQIAISSGGHAPMLARQIREQLEATLDPSLAELALLLKKHRGAIKNSLGLQARRDFFEEILQGETAQLLRCYQPEQAQTELLATLKRFAQSCGAHERTAKIGRVIMVGAGPGEAGLLTLRGLRALNQADVILHDRLVSAEVLQLARRDAQFIEVGKQAHRHFVTQAGIHALMLEHAKAGKTVVRLKGGDGFIFGRGGEELEFLRSHGVPYEVVPGITAALACAAYAGIPLTHRAHAQMLQLATAHFSAETASFETESIDWEALAKANQTAVFYMGLCALARVSSKLIGVGRSPNTPIALIENGARSNQRVVLSNLTSMQQAASLHQLTSPVLLIVGNVTALAEKLHWFGAKPIITGKTDTLRRDSGSERAEVVLAA